MEIQRRKGSSNRGVAIIFFSILGFIVSLIVIGAINGPKELHKAVTNNSVPQLDIKQEAPQAADAKIEHLVIETFDPSPKLTGSELSIKLETELAADAPVFVSVSRRYKIYDKQSKRTEEAEADYFVENTTVGDLKAGRTFTLNNDGWRDKFSTQVRDQAVSNLSFVKNSISQKIYINIGVLRTFSLAKYSGRVITQEFGENTISFEKALPFPINFSSPRNIPSKPAEITVSAVTSKPLQPVDNRDGVAMTMVLCKQSVKANLISPNSADFPFFDQATFGGQKGVLSSSVEASNAFGVKIKNAFTCEVSYTGGDPTQPENWSVTRFTMEP